MNELTEKPQPVQEQEVAEQIIAVLQECRSSGKSYRETGFAVKDLFFQLANGVSEENIRIGKANQELNHQLRIEKSKNAQGTLL